jgi:hypothetical protein
VTNRTRQSSCNRPNRLESLSDPESLGDRDESEFREEQSVDDDDTFEYFNAIDGLATEPVTGEPVSDSPEFGPWDDVELGWFETVPADAYWEHGDAVDDIRSCVVRWDE